MSAEAVATRTHARDSLAASSSAAAIRARPIPRRRLPGCTARFFTSISVASDVSMSCTCPDDLVVADRDQDDTCFEIGIQLECGVLCHLEEWPQLLARPAVPGDPRGARSHDRFHSRKAPS